MAARALRRNILAHNIRVISRNSSLCSCPNLYSVFWQPVDEKLWKAWMMSFKYSFQATHNVENTLRILHDIKVKFMLCCIFNEKSVIVSLKGCFMSLQGNLHREIHTLYLYRCCPISIYILYLHREISGVQAKQHVIQG